MVDAFAGYAMAKAARAAGEVGKVFDWDTAARILRDRKATNACAYLEGDYEWTVGDILIDGEITTEGRAYLFSLWATPILEIDGKPIEYWVPGDDPREWDSGTHWPESAVAIFRGEVE